MTRAHLKKTTSPLKKPLCAWGLLCLVFSGCATSRSLPVDKPPQLPPERLQRERSELEQRAQNDTQGGLSDPALLRELGWALLIEGHWQRAEAVLERARTPQTGGDLRTLLGLALCAQESGQPYKAQELWLRILESAADKAHTPLQKSSGRGGGDPWAAAMAEAAAHRLLTLGADGRGIEAERRLRQRILAVLARKTLPLEAVQLLSALLGQLLRLAGDEGSARRVDAERGCPTHFYLSGPVGHLPALDLLTPFAADDPARDAQIGNYRRRSGYGCSVTLDGSSGRPGVMHAITWVQVQQGESQPLTIESGNAPWALYIDGRLSYLEQDPPRRRHLMAHMAPGWHALVLKVGTAGRVQLQLSAPGVRFFDGPLTQAPRPSAQSAVIVRRRPLAELLDAKSGREEVLRAFLRAQQAHMMGDAEAGLQAIDVVSESVPQFASLTMLRAALLLEDRTRPEVLLRDQTRNLLEQVLRTAPELWRARLSLATLLLQEDHPERAQEVLEAVARPKEPSWQLPLLLYRVLKARGWLIEAEKALRGALALGPSACGVLEAETDLRREQQDVRGALSAAAKLYACNPYSDRPAELLIETGQLIQAQREYERLLSLEPENDEWQSGLARVLMSRLGPGDSERALSLRTALSARSPRNSTYRVDLANTLLSLGRRAEALDVLHAGLQIVPESEDLLRALLALGERGPLSAFRIDGRKVIRDFLAQNPGSFADEPAVLVLDRTVIRVMPTGARLTLTHNIIRVLTKDGLTKFGEVKIPEGAEILTLRTIKSDGTTREPEEIPEKEGVSAPDLEVGDYVEFEYLEHDAPLPAFPRGFLSERFYFASVDAPLDRSEYILVVPADLKLQIDVRGPLKDGQRDVPQAEVKTQEDLQIYTWQKRQSPRMRPEPPLSEATIEEWLPSVRVAAGLSFAGYANFLRDRRVRTLALGREVRAQAIQIVGPLPKADEEPPREPLDRLILRAQKLDEWVRHNIRDGGSLDEPATSILARRQGRRDVLLLALLRAAGIAAEMWLVRPQTAPQLDGPLPDLTAYQEAILAVAPGRGPGGQPILFLDPTYRHLPSGYVRPMLRGARALRLPEPLAAPPLPEASFAEVQIAPEGGPPASWRLLAAAAPGPPWTSTASMKDSRRLSMEMTLAADGSGEVAVRETLSGGPALEWREHVENLSQEKLRQELEQRALGFYFPGASLLDLKYGPMDRDDEPLSIEYRFFAPHLAHRRGEASTSELVLPAPYPVLLSRNYIHVAHRQTPLLLHYVQPTVIDAQIHLPKGARLVQSAPTVELSEFGHFLQQVSLANSNENLTLHAELSLPLLRIEPERYAQFVEFARRIDGTEESIAVFTVSPQSALLIKR